MSNNLVEIKNNQVVVSSRQVAETGMLKNEQTPEMFQKSTYVHSAQN